jgi:hypothetical protein
MDARPGEETSHTLDPYEVGRRELDNLIAWAAENFTGLARNEATTRLQLIDRLFFDCLRWPRAECVAEEPHGRTFADYVFGTSVRLLIEAKREGVYFELPAGVDARTLRIQTLVEDGATNDALQQAIGYCVTRGLPLGAISNGTQVIAFIGSRLDSVAPMSGRAVIYHSLEDIRDNFRHCWDRLSKPGVESYRLYGELQGETHARAPDKLASRLSNYPGFKNRNELAIELSTLGGLVLEDITRDPRIESDFLEQTYCSSGALSQYALVSKDILRTRYSAFFDQQTASQTQSIVDKTGNVADALPDEVVAASLARRPIVLLGDVGVGKSMFIRHFINVEAADVLEDAIVLYVDFEGSPAVARDVEAHVARSVTDQLDADYDIDIYEGKFVRAVYHAALNKFSRSLFGELKDDDPVAYRRKEIEMLDARVTDPETHIPAALNHIVATHHRQVVVFLDNVDQRDDEFQERVFLVAQSMAQSWPVTAFVSLRPETFYKSKKAGTLSAYQLRVFTIAPPRVDAVLKKRLDYAMRLLERTGQLRILGDHVGLDSPSLRGYLGALRMSLDTNHGLVELIDNLAGGNVRRALEFVQAFVGSGHVDSRQIVDAMDCSGRYMIPEHQFLRAIIYGDHEYYDPAVSPIANVLDISTTDGREHFLLPILLSHVAHAAEVVGQEGYVPVAELHEAVESLGFTPSQVDFALRRAVAKGLVEVMPLDSAERHLADRYRITTVGAYTLRRLMGQFAYADAVVVDTPIVDHRYSEQIHDALPIAARIERAEVFRRYLDSEWVPLEGRVTGFAWSDFSDELGRQLRQIERRIEEQRASSTPRGSGFR